MIWEKEKRDKEVWVYWSSEIIDVCMKLEELIWECDYEDVKMKELEDKLLKFCEEIIKLKWDWELFEGKIDESKWYYE